MAVRLTTLIAMLAVASGAAAAVARSAPTAPLAFTSFRAGSYDQRQFTTDLNQDQQPAWWAGGLRRYDS
jgi:hypothetical protein